LDDKIDLLNRENATLEAMAETLFRQWFIEKAKEDWEEGTISDLIDFNPTRKLAKDKVVPFLEMSNLSTLTYAPTYWYDRAFNSGTKFQNGDTLLARITPCLENGKTAYVDFLTEGQIAWGSTEFIVMCSKLGLHSFFSYVVAKYQDFRDYAESCMAGSSGRQRVDVDNLKNYPIFIPDKAIINQFNINIESLVLKMQINNKQIRALKAQRDILLPKLMSNEISF
jgi:type I restriction enzyme S subunit